MSVRFPGLKCVPSPEIYIYILFQQGFYSHYPHIKPQFMVMEYLVLLSYLSPQLFFKIKTFAGLSMSRTVPRPLSVSGALR